MWVSTFGSSIHLHLVLPPFSLTSLAILVDNQLDAQFLLWYVYLNRWHFTPLPNLRPLIFGLTPFFWLHSRTLTPTYSIVSNGKVVFELQFFFIIHNFSRTQQGRKISPWCTVCVCVFFWGGGWCKLLAVDISDIFFPIYQTSRRCKQNDRTMNLHHL